MSYKDFSSLQNALGKNDSDGKAKAAVVAEQLPPRPPKTPIDAAPASKS